jgi:hypothetical protein
MHTEALFQNTAFMSVAELIHPRSEFWRSQCRFLGLGVLLS